MRPIARRPGLLVIAALALAAPFVQAQDKPPTRALRIAVVDPLQVIRESKWAQRLKEQVNQEFEPLRREQAELDAKIQRGIRDLKETYKIGTREYDTIVRDINVQQKLLEKNEEMYDSWTKRAGVEYELTVLQEIEREVQTLAAKWELDLVLRRKGDVSREQDRNQIERLRTMFDNQVVFAAKDLDITKTVISLLDNRKNASGAPVEASGNGGAKVEPAPAKSPGKEEPVGKDTGGKDAGGKDGTVKENEKR